MSTKKAIVIGANIMGLAMARSLAVKGFNVNVFERNSRAMLASKNTFGTVNTISQPDGQLLETALNSRAIWMEICKDAGIWYDKSGVVIAAYTDEEYNVISEFYDYNFMERDIELLGKTETLNRFNGLKSKNLKASLFSKSELVIDIGEVLQKLVDYLHNKYNINFHFKKSILEIDGNKVRNGKKIWEVDKIVICSEKESKLLFPDSFENIEITKFENIILRTLPQINNQSIGANVFSVFSLINYESFEKCKSVQRLRRYFNQNYPEFIKSDLQINLIKNFNSEYIFDISHKIDVNMDTTINNRFNEFVLNYMNNIVKFKNLTIAESQSRLFDASSDNSTFVHSPSEITTVIYGLGKSDTTLAFGLAEKITLKW